MHELPTWRWKHSAMFIAGLVCATGVLVAAGLAEPSTDAATPTVQALQQR